MLRRREYAPARSPTSFSKGGGLRLGFTRRISSKSSTLPRRPPRAIFRASFCACFVNTTRQALTRATTGLLRGLREWRAQALPDRLAHAGNREEIERLLNRPPILLGDQN